MNIIYVSRTCSKNMFSKLFIDANNIPGQQGQKYHKQLIEGFARNGVNVKALSSAPVSNVNSKRRVIKSASDIENSIQYYYLFTINLPLIRNLATILSSFSKTTQIINKNRGSVVICDVLNISATIGALIAAKIINCQSVGIVTDLPLYMAKNGRSLVTRINDYVVSKFDSYVFLTESMDKIINHKIKNSIIIEGQVDVSMENVANELVAKYNKKVCLYAGGLHEKYGIGRLVNAFIQANLNEVELHIYGNGDYEADLRRICKVNDQVKYFGVVPNSVVVEAEIKSTLLINPRPSSEEFTKYSFPSKNMEYMVSGTPVLTTSLPGMPSEYKDFVYLFNDETINGMKDTLIDVLNRSTIELHEMGLKAKKFVLEQKNNVFQSKKIIDMILKGIN